MKKPGRTEKLVTRIMSKIFRTPIVCHEPWRKLYEIILNSFGWMFRTAENRQVTPLFFSIKNIIMRKLIIPLLAFMACNDQPSQEVTTNIKKSDWGFGNVRGNLETIESKTVDFDSTGKADDSTQSFGVYDRAGNLVKETINDNSGDTTIGEVTYYGNGFGKEEKTIVNGVVQVRLTIDSVIKGQHTAAQFWDSAGKQLGYCDVIYNEFGQVTWGKTFDMDGKLQFGWEFKIDGRYTIGSSRTDSTGKVVSQGTIKRNDKNDPAEAQYTTTEEGVTTTRKYTYTYDNYDDKGNWTQQSIYRNGRLRSVTKRAITYYMD